jgi:toxin ParE1/3/4
MKVVYTEEALRDLDAIADWLIVHYPTVAPAVERRIRSIVAHIARWPESSRRSARRPGVRVVSLGRYPYRIFIESRTIRWRYSTSITPRANLGTSAPERDVGFRRAQPISACQMHEPSYATAPPARQL